MRAAKHRVPRDKDPLNINPLPLSTPSKENLHQAP
jgi:hypothetical protein